MFKGSGPSSEKYLSLLEVKVFMEPLLAQIRAVACICFTNKFIDDILAEKEGNKEQDKESEDGKQNEMKFMALLYKKTAFTAENL